MSFVLLDPQKQIRKVLKNPMIIPTLSNGILFIINRDRAYLQDKLDKRRTFLLTLGITICVTISTVLWIVYR